MLHPRSVRCALVLALGGLVGLLTVGQTDTPKGKKYALLVGVNKYQRHDMNRPRQLEYAEADVTEMAKLLRAGGYKVELLTGKAATRAAIVKALENIKSEGDADGVVLVGLAGHGMQLEKDDEAYFAPYDTQMRVVERDGKVVKDKDDNPRTEGDPKTMVKLTDIVEKFRVSPAGVRILLADCSRNGPSAGRGRTVGAGIKTARLPRQTAVLLSCSEGQKAFEDKAWGHGA
jgi:uncharacterized caspase-like protein